MNERPVPLRRSLAISGGLRLLLVTNEATIGDEPGLRDAFSRLVESHHLEAYAALAPRETARLLGRRAAEQELLDEVREFGPNVLLVLTPNQVPIGPDVVRLVRRHMRNSAILYWEGDPWGGPKRPTESMRSWAQAADVVFSTALGHQADLLHGLGAKEVRAICHTYCHVTFTEAAEWRAPSPDSRDVVVIGRNVKTLGLWNSLPGGWQRARLVAQLQRELPSTVVYGDGFRGSGTRGHLPYRDQVAAIRRGAVSANWDHFPTYASYSSDRLAISLVAGRPHVTTRHPESDWMPGEDVGLFLADSPREVVAKVRQILSLSAQERADLGQAAYRWTSSRLSDVQAANFMLRSVDDRLPDVPAEPWGRLARSIRRRS